MEDQRTARRRWEPEDFGPGPSLLVFEPLSLAVLIGAAIAAASALLPWVQRIQRFVNGDVSYVTLTGVDGHGDGVLLASLSLLLVLVTLVRPIAEATSLSVRLVPIVLAVGVVLVWVESFRQAAIFLDQWQSNASIGLGLWMAAIGVLLMLTATLLRTGDPWDKPSGSVARQRIAEVRDVRTVIGGWMGAVIGVFVVLQISYGFETPALVVGGVFGAVLGGYAAFVTARHIGRPPIWAPPR